MKDARFKLEFTTHVLANSQGPTGERDHFQRDSENKIIWQKSWWYSAFAQAIELAQVRGIKPADIHMALALEAPTEVYRRHYSTAEREDCYRKHEAIMPGTCVEFEAIVGDHVTESHLRAILQRMGKYVGLSPYGYKLGFGKFNVLSVTVKPSEPDVPQSTNAV